ncbi:hypothetical protein KI387_004859 [Taxus chinensis]|uniref:Early light-induced protein n=1 Tax=Taxus chinensis TaxID=29808 RepID=A0AA38LI66_TAXCH|nr:hypothetical protein KI387_004859 [Taxus chinensis]
MAAVASMMLRSPAALNCAAVQRNYVGNINRVSHRNLQIKCMAETDKELKETSTTKADFAPPTTNSPSPTKNKISTKFSDLFAFSGPAPEIINGRLAMVGFVSAIGVELASGRDLFSQLSSGGVSWFLISAGLLSAASLIPLFKGVTPQSKSQPIMSSTAEIWNGRFAMLGLLALAFTEYVKGGPLV